MSIPWVVIAPLLPDYALDPLPIHLDADLVAAMSRSVGIAVVSAFLAIGTGFTFAWICLPLRSSAFATFLPLLLLPALAGPASVGFLAKMAILKSPELSQLIAARAFLATGALVILLNLFRFGSLAAYLLWLHGQALPSSIREYAASAKLGARETLADVMWPHSRNLCQVLFVFVFLATATDFVTLDLAIRPSSGTNTTLISHWLANVYRVWFPASPRLAAVETTMYGVIAAVTLIASALFCVWALTRVAGAVAERRGVDAFRPPVGQSPSPLALILSGCAIAAAVSPYLISYYMFPPYLYENTGKLAWAALWSMLAALMCFATSVSVAAGARVWLPNRLLSPPRGNVLALYLLVLAPLALPPLILALSAFRWFGFLPSGSLSFHTAGWLAGHIVVTMPLLLAFTLWIHSRVTSRELEYHRLTHASWCDVARVSFVDRFKRDYFLVFLFSWSLVWNDAVVNRASASRVPSMYALLAPHLSVRPDYRAAQSCLVLSLGLAVAMIALWHQLRLSARSS